MPKRTPRTGESAYRFLQLHPPWHERDGAIEWRASRRGLRAAAAARNQGRRRRKRGISAAAAEGETSRLQWRGKEGGESFYLPAAFVSLPAAVPRNPIMCSVSDFFIFFFLDFVQYLNGFRPAWSGPKVFLGLIFCARLLVCYHERFSLLTFFFLFIVSLKEFWVGKEAEPYETAINIL